MRTKLNVNMLVVGLVLALGLCQIASQLRERFDRAELLPRARADAGFEASYLVTSAGVVSSNGASSVVLLTFPGGYAVPASHRFWCGGVTIFNTDTVTRTPALVSHYSRRVMWTCPLPAGSGVILDNVNMLASDQGTTTHPEGVDLVLDGLAGGNKVGATAQGYVR